MFLTLLLLTFATLDTSKVGQYRQQQSGDCEELFEAHVMWGLTCNAETNAAAQHRRRPHDATVANPHKPLIHRRFLPVCSRAEGTQNFDKSGTDYNSCGASSPPSCRSRRTAPDRAPPSPPPHKPLDHEIRSPTGYEPRPLHSRAISASGLTLVINLTRGYGRPRCLYQCFCIKWYLKCIPLRDYWWYWSGSCGRVVLLSAPSSSGARDAQRKISSAR